MGAPIDLDGSARFDVNPDVLFRRVEDEVVLVKIASNEIFTLNPTAARIWELVSEGSDLNATVVRLLDEFDEPEDDLRGQVAAFVGELRAEGFLVAK